MRTRNSDASKSVTPKRTSARISASKTPPSTAADSSPSPITGADTEPEQSTVVEAEESADAALVTPETKVSSRKKTVAKKVVKVVKKSGGKKRTPVKAKDVSKETPNVEESVDDKDEGSKIEEELDAKDFDSVKNVKEPAPENVAESSKGEETAHETREPVVENAGEPKEKGDTPVDQENTAVGLEKDHSSSAEIVGEDGRDGQSNMNVDLAPNEIVGVSKDYEPNVDLENSAIEIEKDGLSTAKIVGKKDENELNEMNVDMPPNEIVGVSNNHEPNEKDKGKEVEEETKEERNELNEMNVDMPPNEIVGVSKNHEPSEKDKGKEVEEETKENRNELNERNVDMPPNAIVGVSKNHEPNEKDKGKEVEEETKEDQTETVVGKEENKNEAIDTDNTSEQELLKEDAVLEYRGDEEYDEYDDRVDLGDHAEDDFVEDPDEIIEEAEALEDEKKELTAVAKMRKLNKEYEIFVVGLDKEATEDDVKKIYEKIGEVVEVRLHRDLSTNSNKGYAFVKYSSKEHVKRALSEMKNPVIRGKRCRTAPSEDNDTLFLGNICNSWTKEAIRQKLKDYGVEGIENITLVADVQHEGRSRGFAFLDFSCHADAMHAYKRLQKPDVIFGHPERTAKVAFAEPIREPDPEVMAHVKTVFLDGLPPHCDEDLVRKNLRSYGDIVRIVLARNMSTAKRKDFGFVDFSSHEAAVACIEKVNNTEFNDGYSKTRIRARLSNPMPKTQTVKGGMCGGFLINRAGIGTSTRFGRGFRWGGRFNRGNSQNSRGFYQRGHGQPNRMGPNEYNFSNRYGTFHGRQTVGQGGRSGPIRGGYHPAGRGPATTGPSRPIFNRPWNDAPVRGYRDHPSTRRHPFSPEEAFERPYVGRQFDDPYFYDNGARRMKRPFYMSDHDPDYSEPRRLQPRLDYADPAVTFRGTHYPDIYGPGHDRYSHGPYGPEYGEYPPYYRNDRPYGGGYYY